MKKLLSPLLAIFILTGCSNTDELFKKNQECYSHTAELKDKYGEYSVYNVFYSPRENSCLYIRYNTQLVDLFKDKILIQEKDFESYEKFELEVKEYQK